MRALLKRLFIPAIGILLCVNVSAVAFGQAAPYQQDSGSDGIVSIEAENFDANQTTRKTSWEFVSQSGQSGSASMQAVPNSGLSYPANFTSKSPRLDFNINFVKTGTHYIWARGIGLTANDNSYHAGLDGNAVSTSDKISPFGTSWTWNKMTEDGNAASVNISSAGQHTLNVWMMEDGFIIDKIVITTNPNYTPTGLGPAESARGAVAPAAPTLNTAVAGDTQVTLGWSAVSGALGYRVKYGTVSGNYSTTLDAGNVTNDVVTGLTNGTPYYFVITAYNAAGESTNSNEKNATPQPPPPPSAPVLNSATAGNTQVSLSWSASAGATGYKVKYGTSSGSYGTVIDAGNVTTYAVTGLTNGIKYYFVVTALNAIGESSPSNELSATPQSGGSGSGTIKRDVWLNIKGSAITDLTGNPAFPNNPSFSDSLTSFEGPSAGNSYGSRIYGFIHPPVTGSYTFWIASDDQSQLFLSTNANPANKQLIAKVSTKTAVREWTKYAEQKSQTINLSAGQKYYIEALHKEDKGSDHVSVAWQKPGGTMELITGDYLSPYTPIVPPAAPVLNSAVAGNVQVTLTWNAVAAATGYKVKYGTSPGIYGTTIDAGNVTNYTVSGLTNGTKYYFVVLAYNLDGGSGNSNELSATPVAPPAAPVLTIAATGNTQVSLTWAASTGAIGYKVKYGTLSGIYGTTNDAGNVTNYTVNGLTNGTTYYFVVSAYNAGGESGNSNERSANPQNVATYSVDQCVGGLSSASSCNQGCTTQWSHTSAFDDLGTAWVTNAVPTGWLEYQFATPKKIAKYMITPRSDLKSNPKDWTFEAYDETSSQWIILDTRINQTWTYQVTNAYAFYNTNAYQRYRINISANGGWNDVGLVEMEMMELISAGAPDAIQDLQDQAGNGSVVLSWSAPPDGGSPITNYRIEYGTVASGGFDQIMEDDAVSGATVSGLINETTYQFRVVAVNAYGISQPSNVVTAVPYSGTMVSGAINTNTTWTLAGSPYIVVGNINVNSGVVLTIEPGGSVQFNGNYGINVDGIINAQGTADNLITFTSRQPVPAKGDWAGITLKNTSDIFNYVKIEYANNAVFVTSYPLNQKPTIQNSIIQNNNRGITFEPSSGPYILGNKIINNKDGIYAGCNLYTFCSPTIENNAIYDNSQNNLYQYSYGTNVSDRTINAPNNWWGSADLASIENTIYHKPDNGILAFVNYIPLLDGPGGNPIAPVEAPVLNNASIGDQHVVLSWSAVNNSIGYKIKYGTTSGSYGPSIDIGNVMEYTVTGLENWIPYYFVVTAYSATRESGNSNELSATPLPLASIPALVGAISGDTQISLSWEASSNAQGYKVHYGTSAGVYDTTIDVNNITEYTVSGLENWRTYYFTVNAYNDLAESGNSNELAEQPHPPLATYSDDQCSGGVSSASSCNQGCASQWSHTKGFDDLNTTAWVTNAVPTGWLEYQFATPKKIVKYTINPRSDLDGNPKDWTFEAFDETSGQWIILDTRVNQTWTYQVTKEFPFNNTAVYSRYRLNISANGGHEDVGLLELEMLELVTPGIPETIIDLNAQAGDEFVILTWSARGNGGSPITGYQVQYGTVASGVFDHTLDDDAVPGAIITGLQLDTAYQFRVIAMNAYGASASSNVVTATPYFQIVNNSVSERFFNRRLHTATTISYTINHDAHVTIKVFDYKTNVLVRTLVDNEWRAAGNYSEDWDGKNEIGTDLPDGAYEYTIAAQTALGNTGSYDPYDGKGSVALSNINITPATGLSAYKGERLRVSYDLQAPALVRLAANRPYVNYQYFLSQEPRDTTGNIDYWDGRDAAGNIVVVDKPVYIESITNRLPENFIVIQDKTSLDITAVTSDPYVIRPLYNEITQIAYTINQPAQVTVKILTPNAGTVLKVLESDVSRAAGTYFLVWDGQTETGETIAEEGDYRVRVEAVESVGQTTIRDGNIRILY